MKELPESSNNLKADSIPLAETIPYSEDAKDAEWIDGQQTGNFSEQAEFRDTESDEEPTSPTLSCLSFDLDRAELHQFMPAQCNQDAINKLLHQTGYRLDTEMGQRKYRHPKYDSLKLMRYYSLLNLELFLFHASANLIITQ